MKRTYAYKQGFTIVELLVVIVIIGILAAISVVAYNGVLAKARDAQRSQDIQAIAKALEMYYIDNGQFPASFCGSSCPSPKKINAYWLTTSDGSWDLLEQALVPKYMSALPKDPLASTSTNEAIAKGYNYDYISFVSAGVLTCSASTQQIYYLYYNLETTGAKRELIGTCVGTQPTNRLASHYISSKVR